MLCTKKKRKKKRFLRASAIIIQINTEVFYVWLVILSSQDTLNSLCANSVTSGAWETLKQHQEKQMLTAKVTELITESANTGVRS